jgi:GNAT superfamily N-acetyltransferase
MTIGPYEIKRIDSGQLAALAALGRLVWGRSAAPTERALVAKFRTSEFGAEFVGFAAYRTGSNAELGDHAIPAAYYGVLPIQAHFDSDVVLCAQSGDTMTHPEHRGKGLFIRLAQRTYDLAAEQGIEFVFGFPSPMSFPGFSRQLNWAFPYEMVRFTRVVPTLPVRALRARLGIATRGAGSIALALAARFFDIEQPAGAAWNDVAGALPGIVRNDRFWRYKSLDVHFVRFGNTAIALKFDQDLAIGDILGNPSAEDMARIIRRLDLLAGLMGAVRIKSYFSPGSHLASLLGGFGRFSPSLPYGFVNLMSRYDPARLSLSYVDYDTF